MDGRKDGRDEGGPLLLESRVILLCCQRTPKDKEPDFHLCIAIRQGATDGSTSHQPITATPTDGPTNRPLLVTAVRARCLFG